MARQVKNTESVLNRRLSTIKMLNHRVRMLEAGNYDASFANEEIRKRDKRIQKLESRLELVTRENARLKGAKLRDESLHNANYIVR